jgi:hypothetical protein
MYIGALMMLSMQPVRLVVLLMCATLEMPKLLCEPDGGPL